MKKIRILCPDLSGKGGTETVLSTVMQYNKKHPKFDILLLLPYKSRNEQWLKDIPHIMVKTRSRFGLINKFKGLIFIIKQILTLEEVEYICLSTQLIFIVRMLRMVLRKKYTIVSWIHFSLFHEKTVNLKLLTKADYHLVISSGIKMQMRQLGIAENKMFLIYNPVNHHETKNKSSVKNENIKHFAYVGRIIYEGQKNLKEIFEALAIVENKNWRLSIIGSGDKKELDLCKQFITQCGLDNHISWLGWLKNPWDETSNIDAILLSSKYEGFPMVLLEAMSRGIYCISSNCPTGPSDIIIKNVNGNLYEQGNLKNFADLMQKFIELKEAKDPSCIRESISKFYIDEYFPSFTNALNSIIKKR